MTDRTKSIRIIVNPVAGEDEPVIAALNDAFHEAPLDWKISVTDEQGDGARFAREAREEGVDMIAVYGGDGTINDVLQGIYPSHIPMLVLPGGTGNGVVSVLDSPRELKQAAQRIASGDYNLLKADIGRIGDRLFMLRVDIGDVVETIENLERDTKDQYGMLAYYYAVGRIFVDDRDLPFRFILDGEREVKRDAAAFILLNLRRKNPDNHAENIQNGELEFFLVRSGMKELLKGITAYVDLADTDDFFEIFSAKTIRVETPEPLMVLADGEPCGETPIDIELLPQAVTLVVPT